MLSFSAEGRTDALINELMVSSTRASDPQKVLEEIEKERREMEEIFSIKAGKAEKLREQEIKSKLQYSLLCSKLFIFKMECLDTETLFL